MTTIGLRNCSILELDRGASNQAVAPGITRSLHGTGSRASVSTRISKREKSVTKVDGTAI